MVTWRHAGSSGGSSVTWAKRARCHGGSWWCRIAGRPAQDLGHRPGRPVGSAGSCTGSRPPPGRRRPAPRPPRRPGRPPSAAAPMARPGTVRSTGPSPATVTTSKPNERERVGPGGGHDRHAVGEAEAERDEGAGGHGVDGEALGDERRRRYRASDRRRSRVTPSCRAGRLRRARAHWREPGFCVPERHDLSVAVAVGLVLPRRVLGAPGPARPRRDRAAPTLLAHQAADGFVPHMTYWHDGDTARRVLGPARHQSPSPSRRCTATRWPSWPGSGVAVPDDARRAGRRAACGSCSTTPARRRRVGRDRATRGSRGATTAPAGTRGARAVDVRPVEGRARASWSSRSTLDRRGHPVGNRPLRGGLGRVHAAGRLQRPRAGDGHRRPARCRWRPTRSSAALDDAVGSPTGARGPTPSWTDRRRPASVRTLDALLPVLVSDDAPAVGRRCADALDGTAFGGPLGPAGVHRDEPAFDPVGLLAGPGLAPAHLPAVGRGPPGRPSRPRPRPGEPPGRRGAPVGPGRVLAPRHRRGPRRRAPVVGGPAAVVPIRRQRA